MEWGGEGGVMGYGRVGVGCGWDGMGKLWWVEVCGVGVGDLGVWVG